MPLILALQGWMYDWALPGEIKLVLMLAMATPPLFLSYHYLVRHTFIGALLNGRRAPRTRTQSDVTTGGSASNA